MKTDIDTAWQAILAAAGRGDQRGAEDSGGPHHLQRGLAERCKLDPEGLIKVRMGLQDPTNHGWRRDHI